MNPSRIFKDNLKAINSAISSVFRRHGIFGAEAEDFGQDIRLSIIADDYRRLRGFRHESSLPTFLYTIVDNIFLDEQRKRRGRWRPSEIAERLGREAILLEQYCCRDGLPFHESIEILRTNHGSTTPEEELRGLFAQLPPRSGRPGSAEELSPDLSDGGSLADEQLHAAHREAFIEKLMELIQEMEKEFSPEERLMLKLHFQEEAPLAQIAYLLDSTSYKVKRDIDRIILKLREGLLRKGIHYRQAQEFMEESW